MNKQTPVPWPERLGDRKQKQSMNEVEALEYVDVVIEKLSEWDIITANAYGRITEDQRQELATLVSDKSKE